MAAKTMRFHAALFEISKMIDENRLAQMKSNLQSCRNLPPEFTDNLQRDHSTLELFKEMSDRQLATPDNTVLLSRSLESIGMHAEAKRLRDEFGESLSQDNRPGFQSSENDLEEFERCLDHIANGIPARNLPSLKLLCNNVLARDERAVIRSPHELLHTLHRKRIIGQRDIGFLEALLKGEGLRPLADDARVLLTLRRPHDLPLRREPRRVQENRGEQEENIPLAHSACSEEHEQPLIVLPSGQEVQPQMDLQDKQQRTYFKATHSLNQEPLPKRSPMATTRVHETLAENGCLPRLQLMEEEQSRMRRLRRKSTEQEEQISSWMSTPKESIPYDESSPNSSHSSLSLNQSASHISLPSQVAMPYTMRSPSAYSSMSTDDWLSSRCSSSPASTPCDAEHRSLESLTSSSYTSQASQSPELYAPPVRSERHMASEGDSLKRIDPPITGYEKRAPSIPHSRLDQRCHYMPWKYSSETLSNTDMQQQPGMLTDNWSSSQRLSSPASTPCDADRRSLDSRTSSLDTSTSQVSRSPELYAPSGRTERHTARSERDSSELVSPPIIGYEKRASSILHSQLDQFSQHSHHAPQQRSSETSSNTDMQQQLGLSKEKQLGKSALPHCPHISNSSSVGVYPLQRRGQALIVNIEEFPLDSKPPLSRRTGSQVDVAKLQETFAWLGFQVEVVQNPTKKELWEKMLDTARDDHSNFDCFVCALMSHGQMNEIFCCDGACLSLTDVFNLFKNTDSLVGKPKIFFVQACRGKKSDTGRPISADNVGDDDYAMPKLLPSDSDFLLGYATTPERLSFRHEELGSWYIFHLCDTLRKLVPKHESLIDMLTVVNKIVGDIYASNGGLRQIPAPVTTLRHRVVFPNPMCSYCTDIS